MNKFEKSLEAIDAYNKNDPNIEVFKGKEYPKELLYGHRMSMMLCEFDKDASEALRLAARCQHIGRWELPRQEYPMDRIGYIKWRNEQKKRHASIARQILREVGYEDDIIQRVMFLLEKKQLSKDPETQALEDVICLVFISYYLEDFAAQHERDKLLDIVRKTWNKMSPEAQDFVFQLELSEGTKTLVKEALGES